MKDFIEWLGVNEKIAKVVVWLLIIMIMLILTNTLLASLGLSHYQITYQNIVKIKTSKITDTITDCITCILNFLITTLLVFRIKEVKKILLFSVPYMIGVWIVDATIGFIASQIFILLFLSIFSYLYSNKNKKYIIYILLSLVINAIIQGITYYYKASLINLNEISAFTKNLLFSDYFIIMGIIILVKEIYLRKRGE